MEDLGFCSTQRASALLNVPVNAFRPDTHRKHLLLTFFLSWLLAVHHTSQIPNGGLYPVCYDPWEGSLDRRVCMNKIWVRVWGVLYALCSIDGSRSYLLGFHNGWWWICYKFPDSSPCSIQMIVQFWQHNLTSVHWVSVISFLEGKEDYSKTVVKKEYREKKF